MREQRGLTMTGFLVTAVILIIVALLGFKIAPPYMEYYTIQKQIKIVANEVGSPDRRAVERAVRVGAAPALPQPGGVHAAGTAPEGVEHRLDAGDDAEPGQDPDQPG